MDKQSEDAHDLSAIEIIERRGFLNGQMDILEQREAELRQKIADLLQCIKEQKKGGC
jgi:predicted  nucleic acid-binding Zn-ribbon protein